MTTAQQLELAKDQLTRVQSFFSRVDAKHSVVLAVDTGMLAFLAGRAPAWSVAHGWQLLFPIAATLCLANSIRYLYMSGHPTLTGGHNSIVYFREIAKRTETGYLEDFLGYSEEEYTKDLLAQVWRNSEILSSKFDHLQNALRYLAIAILPWLLSLIMFALITPAKL